MGTSPVVSSVVLVVSTWFRFLLKVADLKPAGII